MGQNPGSDITASGRGAEGEGGVESGALLPSLGAAILSSQAPPPALGAQPASGVGWGFLPVAFSRSRFFFLSQVKKQLLGPRVPFVSPKWGQALSATVVSEALWISPAKCKWVQHCHIKKKK